jgi:hypothetical protein
VKVVSLHIDVVVDDGEAIETSSLLSEHINSSNTPNIESSVTRYDIYSVIHTSV